MILVAVFFLQTWLVYSDSSGRQTPPLSDLAARGQDVWHEHNCQSCHQVFGFGGFLGPDLTNAIGTLTDARLESILTEGAGLMPAFHLDADDRAALKQWFVELDRTGVSVPRVAPKLPVDELLDLVATKVDTPLTPAEAAGLATIKKQVCMSCHLPNLGTAKIGGPDLSTALERLGETKVREVLANGVPGTVMPKFGFEPNQLDEVVAYLAWLAKHRDTVKSVFEVTRPGDGWSLRDVPWFEYD